MSFHPAEQVQVTVTVIRWSLVAAAVGVLAGISSAAFLLSLDWATTWREAHPWIIGVLPLGGLLIGLFYLRFGASVEAGNNLVLDEIHDPKKCLPLRMAPMILIGTVATHLFGGSAGREGTAVQMGASLADQVTHWLRLDRQDRRILLMAGISGGFAAVFGTPLAGMVFGMEVLALGAMRFEALLPCLIAALVGDRVTIAMGVQHTSYAVSSVPVLSFSGFMSALTVGAACGITAMVFATFTHGIGAQAKRRIAWMPMRLVIGGAIVALAVLLLGNTRYIGLGIPMIVEAFHQQAPVTDFLLKLLLTAITLGFGFKGGEVTPLFVIGATLGSTLAFILPLPVDVLAAIGFVALFAGAANTPLACIVMACELFGSPIAPYAAVACIASYLFSGHSGIYRAQRIGHPKHAAAGLPVGLLLSEVAATRQRWSAALLSFIHPFGLLGRASPEHHMTQLAALRIFCHQRERVRRSGLLGRWFAPNLGQTIARRAKRMGIKQVILHHVRAGYLPDQPLAIHDGEIPSQTMPVCIELLDAPEQLQRFARHYRSLLAPTRMVMLHCTEIDLKHRDRVMVSGSGA
jgi:H+/Cl- antiporter ClcA/PII-like signaling protein